MAMCLAVSEHVFLISTLIIALSESGLVESAKRWCGEQMLETG